MARGRFYHDPARKHIEQYQDFSKGLNTVSSNENMSDNELRILENVDLGERGSLKRRKGFESKHSLADTEGNVQGLFKYHRRYTPYNLLGYDGQFEGMYRERGKNASIGSWNSFNYSSASQIKQLEHPDGTKYVSLTASPNDAGGGLHVGEHRGLGTKLEGIKENTYYLFLVKFKSDGNGTGALIIRDNRYGVYPEDDTRHFEHVFEDKPTEWTTMYLKLKTYPGMYDGNAYVYNHSPKGSSNTVYYDKARVYEITSEVYDKIDNDPEYTGEALGDKFPFVDGLLSTGSVEETVVAKGGKFYINGELKEIEDDIVVQDERPIEATVYGDNLFIASGSGLLVYNGSTISKITNYIPDYLETLYIGTNALVKNPFEITDMEQEEILVTDVKFSVRYGVVNKPITMRVGVQKPRGLDVEYKFESRNVKDKEDHWDTLREWDTEYFCSFTLPDSGEYQFRVSIRESGEEDNIDEIVIPRYIVKTNEDTSDNAIDGNTIDLCNRILVHWDRIILYGDEAKPDVMYMSDLHNPAYFPTNNTLWFENPRKESITTVVRYRDSLVVFTNSSIQALYGTNPENFERVMMNTDVGCISPRGAEVLGNHIIFPSYDGITLLKSLGTSETRANVELIDDNIRNLVEHDEEAYSYSRDNQYCIVYPNSNRQLRYYYEWGVWTSDKSPSIDFLDGYVENNNLHVVGKDGRIITDADSYSDEGHLFETRVQTKSYYFGEPYAIKKTKELQIMFEKVSETNVDLDFRLDDKVVKSVRIETNLDEEVYRTTIPGKGLAISLGLTHKEDKPVTFVGLGAIFKLKNP